ARQYSGTGGGVALCQVAVTLTYATGRGHALIGRALYLPGACAGDEERRELAGVPEEVMFATKPQLADALLDRAHRLGIRAAFVAGDEVYGGRELRRSIRERDMGYVMAVRANHALTVGSGRAVTAAGAVRMIPHQAWHRMRTGSGTKGTRHYDWAMLEVTSDDTPGEQDGGHSMLLVRRHRYTGTLSYYRCWAPGPVPLSKLIAVASARWRIEEDHQLSKHAAGLDAGQVIPLEVLAPLDRALPARLHLSRRRRRPAAPARRRLRPGRGTDPGHRPRAIAAPARHRHPTAPPGPAPPAALVGLAPPPSVPRPPSPPTLERLRRDNTMITTNYSCRIIANQDDGYTRPKAMSTITLCDRIVCGPRRAVPNRQHIIQPLDVQIARAVTPSRALNSRNNSSACRWLAAAARWSPASRCRTPSSL